MQRRLSEFGRQRTGSASVEFAFIASFLLTVIAVLVDLTQSLARARDASLAAGQIALTIAQSCADSTCVAEMARTVRDRGRAILPTSDAVDIVVYDLVKTSGIVKGATADVPAMTDDVFEAAQAITRDGDTAVAVRVRVLSSALLASFLARDNPLSLSLVRVAVAVRSSAGS